VSDDFARHAAKLTVTYLGAFAGSALGVGFVLGALCAWWLS
jgi:hypothetical protein